MFVDGDGEGLSTGQPLLDQVSGLAHSISGGAAFADALACIAALGTASLEDLELVADISRVTYGDLIDWLETTAQGGLVERNGEQWAVLRPLQTLIVASAFFGERKKRRWVTFSEGLDHGSDLPTDLRPAWRAALTGADPNHLSQHGRWRLQKMLKHAAASDPDLCADWFITNSATLRVTSRARRTVDSLSEVLRDLPRDQKRRVCTSLSNDDLLASGFAGEFLATDEALTEELLRDSAVDVDTLLSAMSGLRDYTVEGLAPALVRAGVAPARIADRVLSSRHWSGSEAAAIRHDLEFFAALREERPELTEVCAAATGRLEYELDRATAVEKQERLLGW